MKKNIKNNINKNKFIKKIFGTITLSTFILTNCVSFASTTIRNMNEARQISSDVVAKVEELKRQHPNWNFEFVNTNYNFEDMVKMQFGEGRGLRNGFAPINLIESYGGTRYNDAWLDPERKHLAFDANRDKLRWQAPSIEAVRYFLDPRTYINENDIFLFLSLQGNNDKFDEVKTKTMIRTVLAGTKNESRVDEVYNAAKIVDIDVLEIATKLRQEGGLEPNRGINAYNPLNVGATGSDPELEGLKYAEARGWDTFEKGLIGTSQVVKNNYIGRGQDTKYFMKFNVANGSIYHQYMQNITAPLTEGKSLKNAYQRYDSNLSGSYTFKIPLFKNMPTISSPRPRIQNSNNNATITTDLLYLRDRPSSTSGNRLTSYGNGKDFEVIEEVKSGTDGIYSWYKVKVDNVTGYFARYRLSTPNNKYFDIYKQVQDNTNTTDNTATQSEEVIEKVENTNTTTNATEISYINEKEKFVNKLVLKDDYIYFAYNSNLAEFIKSHQDIEVYENVNNVDGFEVKPENKINISSLVNRIKNGETYTKEELQSIFKTGNLLVLNTIINKEENIKFTRPLKIINKGDVTKDGKLSLDDLMKMINVINEEETLDKLQKVSSFIQLDYDIDKVKDMEVNILNASNITFGIFDNINKKYND